MIRPLRLKKQIILSWISLIDFVGAAEDGVLL